jgi:hypothetical protein
MEETNTSLFETSDEGQELGKMSIISSHGEEKDEVPHCAPLTTTPSSAELELQELEDEMANLSKLETESENEEEFNKLENMNRRDSGRNTKKNSPSMKKGKNEFQYRFRRTPRRDLLKNKKLTREQKISSKSRKDITHPAYIPDHDYEVESILEYRDDPDGRKYLIKYKGFTNRYNEWKTRDELKNCADLLQGFERTLALRGGRHVR